MIMYSCWMRRWLNCHKNQRAGTTWYVLLLYLLLPLSFNAKLRLHRLKGSANELGHENEYSKLKV